MTRDKLYAWLLTLLAVAGLATGIVGGPDHPPITTYIFWIVLLIAVELLPVSLGFATVTMAFPVYLAVALLFDPTVAMIIAGISGFDPREIRREVALHHALFNRAQTILSVGIAALAFSPFRPDLTDSKQILEIAAGSLLCAFIYTATNLTLVSTWIGIRQKVPVSEALKSLIPSPAMGFWISYGLLGGLGVATAIVYQAQFGAWAVAAFLIPLLFARISIQASRTQQELSERVQKQQEALLEATEKVFYERENERKRIAADIHDSSLQMLAAASYGLGNTEMLIDAARYGDAKSTVETARSAIESGISGLRDSLADLRRSAVEEGGLVETIEKFASQISTLWGVEVEIKGTVVNEPPIPVALAAFQILQEGLTNAIKHAQTSTVTVRITEEGSSVRIAVEDDGAGFDTGAEVGEDHVGMRLMKERAARVGGRIELDSRPGEGTRLEAILPGGVAQ